MLLQCGLQEFLSQYGPCGRSVMLEFSTTLLAPWNIFKTLFCYVSVGRSRSGMISSHILRLKLFAILSVSIGMISQNHALVVNQSARMIFGARHSSIPLNRTWMPRLTQVCPKLPLEGS